MQKALKKQKQSKNYLRLLPVDLLAKILLYFPESERRSTIAKMGEFDEALNKHKEYLNNISSKSHALVQEDKDLNSAAALVARHRSLLTRNFCANLVEILAVGDIIGSSNDIADTIHASAKEIDPTCIVGKIVGDHLDLFSLNGSIYQEDGYWRVDWDRAVCECVRVIWVQFGDVVVHYQLNPTIEMNESREIVKRTGCVELNVYVRASDEKIFGGRRKSTWTSHRGGSSHDRGESSVVQVGEIDDSEDVLVLLTALSLAADVGKWSSATTEAYEVAPGTKRIVENAGCALRLLGRSFSRVKPDVKGKAELMTMLC